MARKVFVVIVGCGRFGSFLANRFSSEGSSVVVIDPDPESFTALRSDFSGFTIEGNAFEFAVLKQAKTARADVFVAATEKDSTNLFCADVAKTHFKVPRVVARVYEPEFTEIFRNTGIEIVCPALISSEHFFRNDLTS